MIAVILMVLDLISFVFLSILHFGGTIELQFALLAGFYLIGKGLMFRDVMSIVDAIIGVYVIVVFLTGISTFLYWIILGWFIYKLLFTFLYMFEG